MDRFFDEWSTARTRAVKVGFDYDESRKLGSSRSQTQVPELGAKTSSILASTWRSR